MKVILALLLVVSTTCAFVPSPPQVLSSPMLLTTKLQLFKTVEEAIAEAQRVCAADPSSPECKVAWDIVEELEAANSHKDKKTTEVMPQSTDYHAFMGSFDILCQKIDGKMDQLMATAVKLHELGASDPSIEALYSKAEEMKQALRNARSTL